MKKMTPLAAVVTLLLVAGLIALFVLVTRESPEAVDSGSETLVIVEAEVDESATEESTSSLSLRGDRSDADTPVPMKRISREPTEADGPVHSSDIPTDNAAHYFLLAYEMSTNADNEMLLQKFLELGVRGWQDPEVQELLERMAPIFETIRKGLEVGNADMPDALVDSDEMLPYMAWWRTLGRASVTRANFFEAQADYAAAIDEYTTLLSFASEVPRGSAVIHGLVGYAISGMSTAGLQNLIESGQVDASMYASLARGLIDLDLEGLTAFDLLDGELGFAQRQIQRNPAYSGEALQEMVNEYYGHLEQLGEWFALPYPELKEQDIEALVGTNIMSQAGVIALFRTADASARNQASVRATATMAALEGYRAEHGEYPPALDALAPSYLPTVPIDPFTGAPLIYRTGDGGYTLYSTGADMTDNEGVDGGFTEEGSDLVFH